MARRVLRHSNFAFGCHGLGFRPDSAQTRLQKMSLKHRTLQQSSMVAFFWHPHKIHASHIPLRGDLLVQTAALHLLEAQLLMYLRWGMTKHLKNQCSRSTTAKRASHACGCQSTPEGLDLSDNACQEALAIKEAACRGCAGDVQRSFGRVHFPICQHLLPTLISATLRVRCA